MQTGSGRKIDASVPPCTGWDRINFFLPPSPGSFGATRNEGSSPRTMRTTRKPEGNVRAAVESSPTVLWCVVSCLRVHHRLWWAAETLKHELQTLGGNRRPDNLNTRLYASR